MVQNDMKPTGNKRWEYAITNIIDYIYIASIVKNISNIRNVPSLFSNIYLYLPIFSRLPLYGDTYTW